MTDAATVISADALADVARLIAINGLLAESAARHADGAEFFYQDAGRQRRFGRGARNCSPGEEDRAVIDLSEFETWTQEKRDAYFAEAAANYRTQQAGAAKLGVAAPPQPEQPLTFVPAYTKGLVALTAADLLKREFPARDMILAPWLPEKGLTMVFAERGIGKTWVGINAAYTVASGGSFLRWRAPRARRTVYIDGEMPDLTLKDRLAAVVAHAGHEAPDDYLTFVAADMQQDGLPDLANPDAQRFYDAAIKDADLIVVDNLSTICRGLRENEADSWGPVQEWCLRQRAAGKSVLLVHHAGKGGSQRGTSRKEDVLDSVISLRRPVDYDASQGARFEVHFTKSRGFYGPDAEPFEARLSDGVWSTSEIVKADDDDAIAAYKSQGLSVREIAALTGVPRSTVSDKLKRGGPK